MYKIKENKKGISLIVLVITIIVIIILAAAVILTLTNNNPIAEARKATFLNDVATFKDDLNMYTTNEYAKRMGDYDPSLLNATTSGLTYNGSAVSGQDNIYDAIPSLEGKSKYANEFEVEAGVIKYVGTDTEKRDWFGNNNIIIENMPTITLTPTIPTNGNVTATITKANVEDNLEYSINGTTWNVYTTSFTVTNNLTLYVREIDSENNVLAQTTQIISNIDKILPQKTTISLTTAGDKINGTITMLDNESGINVNSSKYIVSTQSTAYATTDAIWNSATVMGIISKTISDTKTDGMYYVQVLSVDNAGNKRVDVSSSITVVNLPIVGTALSSCTWEEIGKIADRGLGDTYFNIGDEINITLSTNEVITMQIYDFNHDNKTDGTGKANITFGCKDIIQTKRPLEAYNEVWDWCSSSLYHEMNKTYGVSAYTILDKMPTSLQTIIKPVEKFATPSYNAGYPITLIEANSKLFLLSDEEIFGVNTGLANNRLSLEGEGYQYPIFLDKSNIIKKLNGIPHWYWLRTGDVLYWWYVVGETSTFTGISEITENLGIVSQSKVNGGVVFCFAI